MSTGRLKIFIVGAGRAGGALALALSQAGHSVSATNRTRKGRARAARLGIPPESFPLHEADAVLLTVPDRAVAETAKAVALVLTRGQVVCHCSGALDLDALAPARRRGAHVGSLHPLCAIPAPDAPLAGAAAAVDGDLVARRILTRLARDAGLRPFRLRPGRRGLYHASAALASNGLVALVAESAHLLERCGLSEKDACAALLPLLRSALRGVEERGLPGALTGPIARGDAEIIERHLAALASAPRSSGLLYRTLGLSLVGLSRKLGAASADDLDKILGSLGGQAPRRGRSLRSP